MEAISTKSSLEFSEDDSDDKEEDADIDSTSALADFSDKVNIDKSLITSPPPGTQLEVQSILSRGVFSFLKPG